ncbi:MAG: hypothetical protein GX376_02510 [Firmicutes bacterium]|nr:hypothetical protein [Bacillota bacterium]
MGLLEGGPGEVAATVVLSPSPEGELWPDSQSTLAKTKLVKKKDYDLDGDGTIEEYILEDGRLRVWEDSRLIYESPVDWWVDYFFLGDANNDGLDELNLLVWKAGSFGRHKPLWLEEEDDSIKNHLFIFNLADGKFKPLWQSSNLSRPNYRAALIDSNGDGELELLALEGSYADGRELRLTLWKWDGWGFSRLE